jgi:adenylate cyclase
LDGANLVAELKRRRVFRVLVGYGIVSFAVLQIIEPIMHALHLPDVTLTYVVLALALGFPVAVVLAWAFDVNEGRIERTVPAASQTLKGVRLALVLVCVGLLAAAPGIVWYFVLPGHLKGTQEPPTVAAVTPSIAVLPFVNLSSDKEQEYFSDGIAEEILNALAQVDGLRVIARTSSFSFKGKNEDMRSVAEKLGAANVLEGSVRKEGGRVRVTAQLIEAAGGSHLWSRTFERELTSIFALQDEIARAVVEALKVKLLPGKGPGERKATQSQESWDLYLRGEAMRVSGSVGDLRGAERLLRKAIEVAPGFALAMAQLSRVLNQEWWTVAVPDSSRLDESRALARKALELQPDLPEAEMAIAFDLYHSRDYAASEEKFRRVLAVMPSCGDCWRVIGFIQRRRGQWEESLASFKRSLDLDPRNEETLGGHVGTLTYMRRYTEAADAVERQMRLSIDADSVAVQRGRIEFVRSGDARSLHAALDKMVASGRGAEVADDLWELAMEERRFESAISALRLTSQEMTGVKSIAHLRADSLRVLGRKDEAIAALREAEAAYQRFLRVRPDDASALALLAMVDAALGKTEDARAGIARAHALLPESRDAIDGVWVSWVGVWVMMHLGETDRAVAEIERLATVPAGIEWPGLLFPIFDPLRANPRFQTVVARLRSGSTVAGN